MKTPAFQHDTGDWRKDPAVRACGLEARGLWFEMMNLMHESPDRGYLLVGSGRPMSVPQLARAVGSTLVRVKRLLAELGPDGAIFCRRMGRGSPGRTGTPTKRRRADPGPRRPAPAAVATHGSNPTPKRAARVTRVPHGV